MLFGIGLLLALPLVGTLLVANIALGVLTKVAPTLNLFAVGFPVTLMAGFVVLALSMPHFAPALEGLFGQGFEALRAVLLAGR
jgi:flagellar biosynthetic protein FliR